MRVILSIALISILASACSKVAMDGGVLAQECATTSGPNRLVVFGDSNSAGYRSEIDGCKYSFAYEIASQRGMPILNQAVGGTSLTHAAEGGLSQLDQISSTSFQSDDTVVWLVGFNDAEFNGANAQKLSDFKSELAIAITQISSQVSQVIIATPIRLPNYPVGSLAATNLYSQAVKDVVAILSVSNVTLIDITSDFQVNREDLKVDGVHLTSEAQARLAREF